MPYLGRLLYLKSHAKCALLLVRFDRRERFLGKRIAWYCIMMGRREEIIHKLELEDPPTTLLPNNNDDADDNDPENAKYDNKARRDWLEALRARHLANRKRLQCVVELHKGIIAEMEMLRWRMDDLVEKQDGIMDMLEE